MSVDANAIARVVGIDTVFKDLRGGSIQFLPQRIAVFAQIASSVTPPDMNKIQITSSGQAGSRFGFGSPADLIAEQLFPDNGDGVGTIPVTIYPLADAVGSAPSVGDITPTGSTMSVNAAFQVRYGGRASAQFVAPAGTINAAWISELLGRIGDVISADLRMPGTVSYAYGTVTATAFSGGAGDGTISALSLTGTPRPGAYTLKLVTPVTNGGVWSLTDPTGVVITSSLTMTPGAGGATVLSAGGIQFTLTDGSTDFGTGVQTTITVAATKINLTSKWKGASANGLKLEVLGDSMLGVGFTVTQPTGGLVNPDVTSALAQMGNVWESMVLNALEIADTTTLDRFQTVGDGRWGATVRKPFVCFTGTRHTTVAAATAVSAVRRTDKVNAQLVCPGSPNVPFVIAARELARIAKVANDNPPTDYGAQEATGLIPGLDGEQWDYISRDAAMKVGSSTVEVNDGVVNISDVVTFYRPSGEAVPAYRYVVDVVKLQNVIYNFGLVFEAKEWASAPLIPDGQQTTNPNARHPSDAVAAACAIIDSLGENAIISDPKTAKKNTSAGIDPQNPKRLNLITTIQLAGNTNVKAITLQFGFFFGAAA